MIRPSFVSPLFAALLFLGGCERPAAETVKGAQGVSARVVSYPIESQLDKFEFRPNECAGDLLKILAANKFDPYRGGFPMGKPGRLHYLPGADPGIGGAGLNTDRDSEELGGAWWYQSLDLNDDGLCDFVGTSFAGDQANGQQFKLYMRTGPGFLDLSHNMNNTAAASVGILRRRKRPRLAPRRAHGSSGHAQRPAHRLQDPPQDRRHAVYRYAEF